MPMPDPWRQQRTLLVALLWAILPSVLALLVAPRVQDPELRGVIYTGAGALFFGGFLGGMLKVLIDEVVAAKRRREDAAQFVINVLSDLKGVYDRVGRARVLLPAYQSLKVYGAEMRDLIDARIQLRNVARALERRADGVRESTRTSVTAEVNLMAGYIEGLTHEFRDNYRSLVSAEQPWARIATFPAMADFIGALTTYHRDFEQPLDHASELLRQELARVLRGI
jgi:hypothetical protein